MIQFELEEFEQRRNIEFCYYELLADIAFEELIFWVYSEKSFKQECIKLAFATIANAMYISAFQTTASIIVKKIDSKKWKDYQLRVCKKIPITFYFIKQYDLALATSDSLLYVAENIFFTLEEQQNLPDQRETLDEFNLAKELGHIHPNNLYRREQLAILVDDILHLERQIESKISQLPEWSYDKLIEKIKNYCNIENFPLTDWDILYLIDSIIEFLKNEGYHIYCNNNRIIKMLHKCDNIFDTIKLIINILEDNYLGCPILTIY